MDITRVLSNLGGWEQLNDEFENELLEIRQVIANIRIDNLVKRNNVEFSRRNQIVISSKSFHDTLMSEFKVLGWEQNTRLVLEGNRRRWSSLDLKKKYLGVEILLGKFAFAESHLFVKFPLFIKANEIKLPILLLPNESLSRKMPSGVGNYELIRDRLFDISPLQIKYPFVILGISDMDEEVQITELVSKIDRYLFKEIGMFFVDIQFSKERTNFDFKLQLPKKLDKLAKLVCAFSNQSNGGLVIIGVDDNGKMTGILRDDLDEIQQQIANIVRDKVKPIPEIDFEIFEKTNTPDKCILITRVKEFERKPCMVDDKVYIRVGSTTPPATSEQIRRLLLGKGA